MCVDVPQKTEHPRVGPVGMVSRRGTYAGVRSAFLASSDPRYFCAHLVGYLTGQRRRPAGRLKGPRTDYNWRGTRRRRQRHVKRGQRESRSNSVRGPSCVLLSHPVRGFQCCVLLNSHVELCSFVRLDKPPE